MERGVLISGARWGTNILQLDGPVSNGFGVTSPGTYRYTIGCILFLHSKYTPLKLNETALSSRQIEHFRGSRW